MSAQRTLYSDVAKAIGLPPFDGPANPCYGDAIFHADCARYWGDRAWEDALGEARSAKAPQTAVKPNRAKSPDPANTGAEIAALLELAADIDTRLLRLYQASQPIYRLLLQGPSGTASDLFMALSDLNKAHNGIPID